MSSTRKTPQYTAYGLPSCQSISVTAVAVTAAAVTVAAAVTAAVAAAATAAAVTAAAAMEAAAMAAAAMAAAAMAAAATAVAVTAVAVTAAAATAAAAGLDFIWVEDPARRWLARVRHRTTGSRAARTVKRLAISISRMSRGGEQPPTADPRRGGTPLAS